MLLTSSAEAGGLPLVVEPEAGGDRSVDAAVRFLTDERALAQSKLLQHGALLFRGFAVKTPADFERVVRGIGAQLKKDYLGTSPRNALTEYVFSASELPPFYPIPQHCEMSFIAQPPRRLFFSCLVANQGLGGETPLCDFRAVYRDLDPKVREKFTRLGVRNIRNYGGPDGRGRFDLWQLKPWHEMFDTTDRAVVEAKCAEAGLECTWEDDGRLRLSNTQAATRNHPQTGETVWFNHSQVFHLSAAQGEYKRILSRIPLLRYQFLKCVAGIGVIAKRLRGGALEHPMHCTYGDGSEIPDSDMERVRDAIWRNLKVFRWRTGDVLMIDNFAVSHGRMPYQGPRQVVVCWE